MQQLEINDLIEFNDQKANAREREIDLCLMPRTERHPLVFAAFDRLAVGESFVIYNDHDPQPLRVQIEQLHF